LTPLSVVCGKKWLLKKTAARIYRTTAAVPPPISLARVSLAFFFARAERRARFTAAAPPDTLRLPYAVLYLFISFFIGSASSQKRFSWVHLPAEAGFLHAEYATKRPSLRCVPLLRFPFCERRNSPSSALQDRPFFRSFL